MAINISEFEVILYVHDPILSKQFYESLLKSKPVLDVPGMTEFQISPTCKLGLMPNDGIAKVLQPHLPHPHLGTGIPRCELYFYVDDIENEYQNIAALGINIISELSDRDWGDRVFYFSDPDGHVIAFAQKNVY